MKEKLKAINFSAVCDVLLLIPILFAAAVIPLVVRITYYNPQLSGYSWFPDWTLAMDMFMFYKNNAMMLLDGVLAVLFVVLLIRRRLPAAVTYAPLGIYLILVIISSIFSIAPTQTWHGFYDMMETAFALFGYCMICYYTFAVVRSETQIKIILSVLFLGVFVLCVIGVLQFLGRDPYMSDWGKNLIFPAKYAGFKKFLTLTFGERRVYASLYNPNYVGVYACIIVPFLQVLSFSMQKKRFIIIYFVLAALILTCLVGAGSKTAVLAIIPCMIFAAFYYGKKHWKKLIPVFAVYIAIFAGLNVYQASSSVFVNAMEQLGAEYIPSAEYHLTDITLGDDAFTITYDDTVLDVKYLLDSDGWSIEVRDQGEIIRAYINEEQTGYEFHDARFADLQFIFGADQHMNAGFSITSDGHSFFIYYDQNQNTYLYRCPNGNATKIYNADTFDFPLFHMLGGLSGRGYIWSKSIPLLKSTFILGSGPDTYAFMFPQYDYVSLIQNGWEGIMITKPHNMYLQMAVQTGVLSLIAFLVFYLWYMFASFKLYRGRKLVTLAERIGGAIFLSSICFMIAGLVNDSTIGVSVVYWTLLGLGFACNRMVAAQPSEATETVLPEEPETVPETDTETTAETDKVAEIN
ncbi:MAG: O-antigen ligase family protein [Muribaculaceae bacterium]|nr:O-antigen ligase family protein [Roseburia sp.]MCM1429833.1 O-antigen ligase family protein [Muribaculaceae bacterium]MCM1492884.1 O-antigen ligase family protein [Muribaculaceae bacterium]